MDILPAISDHKIWGLKLNKETEHLDKPQHKLKSVKWEKFGESLEDKLKDLKICSSANEMSWRKL